jgi:tetratricopeptide (TPR) repeat protein
MPPKKTAKQLIENSNYHTGLQTDRLLDNKARLLVEPSWYTELFNILSSQCVGRKDYLAKLNAMIEQDKHLILLLGEPGIGKSTLLAKWAYEHTKVNPGHFFFIHIAGDSPSCTAVKDIFDSVKSLQKEIENKIISPLADLDKLIIVIDVLDLVEENINFNLAELLSDELSSNIYIVLSVSPGKLLWELTKQFHTELVLKGLNEYERRVVLRNELSKEFKYLSEEQTKLIIESQTAGNPLFLTLTASFIRDRGENELLDELINACLGKNNPAGLYDLLFERLERRLDSAYSNEMRKVMSMLWAVKFGIFEDELLELTGITKEHWQKLYPSISEWILNGTNGLVLVNEYVHEAVRIRYLSSLNNQKDAWNAVVKFLIHKEKTPRSVSEIIRLLELMEEWSELNNLLIDREVFRIGWEVNRIQYITAWQTTSNHIKFHLDGVMNIMQDPNNVWKVVELLDELDQISISLAIKKQLAEVLRKTQPQTRTLSIAIAKIIDGALMLKKADEALRASEELEALSNHIGDNHGMLVSITGRADAWRLKGDFKKSKLLYKKVIDSRIINEHKDIYARCLVGLGLNHLSTGQLIEALESFQKGSDIYRRFGNKQNLAESLNYQAQTCDKLGYIDEAIKLLENQMNVSNEIGFKRGIYAATGNLGNLLDSKFERGAAERYRKKAMRIGKELEEERDTYALIQK